MKVESLYSQISKEMESINLSFEASLFEEENIVTHILNMPYYKALAAYCKIFSPKKVLEIGTCSGASSACLAKYCDDVLTLDVDMSNVKNMKELEKLGIKFLQVEDVEYLNYDFSQYDFIFVDIDHTGSREILIHNSLKETYTGFVYWDDVQMHLGMKSFWDSVENPKIVTNWNFTGFGIVKY